MNVQNLKINRSGKKPGRRRGNPWFVRVIVLSALGLTAWVFWSPVSILLDTVRLPLVEVERIVERHPAAAAAVRGTAANGHIIAARRAALSADTPGRIVEMRVTEGSIVKAGDIVARLYADEYAAALRQADAELSSAQAQARRAAAAIGAAEAELDQHEKAREAAGEQVADAKASLDLAREQFDRANSLLERGVASQSEFDQASANLDSARARSGVAEADVRAADATVSWAKSRISVAKVDLEAAEAQVTVRKASRDLAQATLDKTEIRAPFDGIVVLKDAEVGEVVSPNSQGGSSARGSICTMVDLHSLEAQAEVPEASLAAVREGEPASIFLDAYPDNVYLGQVDRIWPTADRQKATVEVRIKFDEPDGLLRPEMGVRIVFALATQEGDITSAILVSEDSIVEDNQQVGVFIVERDTVRFTPVQTGDRRSGRIDIQAGLSPGQRIVLNPPPGLADGDRVRLEKK